MIYFHINCKELQIYFIVFLIMEGADSAFKDINYFVTSVVSAATAFTVWQTLKNQYYIFQKKNKIRQI